MCKETVKDYTRIHNNIKGSVNNDSTGQGNVPAESEQMRPQQIDSKGVVFAIDLLWLRSGKVGGTESFVRNLIRGLLEVENAFECYLIVAADEADGVAEYTKDPRFHSIVCEIQSAEVGKRIVWENLHLGALLRRNGIDKLLEPVYSLPILGMRGIACYTVIHDIQAIHFPQYFSKAKNLWFRMSWKSAVKGSKCVIATTNYTAEDLARHYPDGADKIATIPIPILIDYDSWNETEDEAWLEREFHVQPEAYYYVVSSLLPHKNLLTLIRAMAEIPENERKKLLISGVGGEQQDALLGEIQQRGLQNNVSILPFLSNEQRNLLYRNCAIFLFPSMFEGFGMPPVEAMLCGNRVITTQKTSLGEVTMGMADYVEKPMDASEWAQMIQKVQNESMNPNEVDRIRHKISKRYNCRNIAEEYLELLGK